MAKYLMELTIVDYDLVHQPPSLIAAAALCLSMRVLDDSEWVSSTPGAWSTLHALAAVVSSKRIEEIRFWGRGVCQFFKVFKKNCAKNVVQAVNMTLRMTLNS